MKKSYDIDINVYSLYDTLVMFKGHKYPRDVIIKLNDFIDFLDDKMALDIPNGYDIIDEKWKMTYLLEKN